KGRDKHLLPGCGPQHQERRNTVDYSNTLQNAWNAQDGQGIPPGDVVQGVQHQPQAKEDNDASSYPKIDAQRRALWPTVTRQGKRHRDANNEQEGRKDEIGERPAVPGGMQQGRENVTPVASVVDQNHPGDSETTQSIERLQAGS